VPQTVKFGNDVVVPLRAGETLPWKLAEVVG
jgi:dihydroorotase